MRENLKSVVVQYLAISRTYAVKIWQSFGGKADENDVFYLTLCEIRDLVSKKISLEEAMQKVALAKEEEKKWKKIVTADAYEVKQNGMCRPVIPKCVIQESADQIMLKGVVASAPESLIVGIARVCRTPQEATQLSKGDILGKNL